MSVTLLVDGNALSYVVPVNKYNTKEEYTKQYFNKLRDYAKNFTAMVKVIVFFDNKVGGTWRDTLYSEYQKGRKASKTKKTDAEYAESVKRAEYLSYIKECFNNSKYDYVSYPHTESDDLIALYCKKLQQDKETIVILTTDKDLYQLISEDKNKKVQIYSLTKHKLFKDEKEGKEALENKIMLGDASDSIPSVCVGVGATYYPDFKLYLEKMKENNIDPTDENKAKAVCESLNIKFIKSFTNYDAEQHKLNKKLIDLDTICELDDVDDKLKYMTSILNSAKVSPYALYNIR